MERSDGKRRWLLIGGAAVLVAGAVLAIAQFASASDPGQTISSTTQADAAQVVSVQNAFTAGITANFVADAPGRNYQSAAAAAAANGQPGPTVTAAESTLQLQSGLATLSKYFTPAQAQRQAVSLRTAISNEGQPGYSDLGQGVSKVQFVSITVQGNTATLEAHVTAWAKFRMRQPNGSWQLDSPVNVVDYASTLVRDSNGNWLINSLNGNFLPGEGP